MQFLGLFLSLEAPCLTLVSIGRFCVRQPSDKDAFIDSETRMTRVSSPPSSRRLRTPRDVVIPSFLSRAMQDLLFAAVKRSVEGRYLLLIAQDEPELPRFIRHLANHRGVSTVTPVQETIAEGMAEVLSEKRGYYFPNGRQVSTRAIQTFVLRHQEQGNFRMVCAIFPNEKALKATLEKWPPEMRKLFHPEPLIWPRLADRQADFDCILDNVCASLISEDGYKQAQLSPKARSELLRTRTSVNHWLTTIKCAFDVMLRAEADQITVRHLHVARNPTLRREYFTRTEDKATGS